MFVIRQASVDDAPTLLKLAKMVHFINLPADPDIINSKIIRSRRSFAGQVPSEREREFMFVLEDTDTGNVIGTASIISCISWPGRPHTFLNVRKREYYSEDLQTGHVHTTLQLGVDETGPSEIGGLILSPSYRGHSQRLGAQLSLIRFHFIALHPSWFSDRMPKLSPDHLDPPVSTGLRTSSTSKATRTTRAGCTVTDACPVGAATPTGSSVTRSRAPPMTTPPTVPLRSAESTARYPSR